MSVDVLIYALVAAGLIFWLRGVLGTRHGDERQRPNPFTSQNETAENQKNAASQPAAVKPTRVGAASLDEITEGLERHMEIKGLAAESGLVAIAKADRAFDLHVFMKGAQDAFVMVVEAFAEGDREALGMLLNDSLYKAFDKALSGREKRNETASVEIHSVRRAEVIDARLKKRMAYITVRFVSDETNVVRDEKDKVISGNPERVTETIDIWTFGRDVRSRSPAWLVYETRDEDAEGQDHKTVPDSD